MGRWVTETCKALMLTDGWAEADIFFKELSTSFKRFIDLRLGVGLGLGMGLGLVLGLGLAIGLGWARFHNLHVTVRISSN